MTTILKTKITSFLLGAQLLCATMAYAEPTNIYISKIVDHPALDATAKGIIDALKAAGYDGTDLNLRIESAQGNPALAQQIASKFVNLQPALVVGIGTVSAQSFAKYALEKKVKLVFSSITDPAGAGLVIKEPDTIYGVSNFIDLGPQLALFKEIMPKLKTIGVLYNPGESNSVSIVKKLEVVCPKLGLKLATQTIAKTADVAQGITKLSQTVDAIFISNDNTALSAMPLIIKTTQKAGIPVFVSDADAVETGAVAALGPNQYEVGQQTGRMMVRLLRGQPMPAAVEYPAKTDLVLNLDAAAKFGLTIPKALIQKASKVYPKEGSCGCR